MPSASVLLKKSIVRIGRRSVDLADQVAYRRRYRIRDQFDDFTMIPRRRYVDNLALAEQVRNIEGAVVECGVWRGGMIAGIATTLGPDREYVLFDSFEGLPPAGELDGAAAIAYQADKDSPEYFDNCSAELSYARNAMMIAGVGAAPIYAGWFDATVPKFAATETPIALLRLDGDWYESTLTCLQHLFPLVVDNGLVLIDDYGSWEGCNKAVHRYMADQNRPEAIQRTGSGFAWFRKQPATT